MTESVIGLISWMTSQPSWMTITTAAWHLMHSLVQLVLPKNGTQASALHSSGTLLLSIYHFTRNIKKLLKNSGPIIEKKILQKNSHYIRILRVLRSWDSNFYMAAIGIFDFRFHGRKSRSRPGKIRSFWFFFHQSEKNYTNAFVY